MAKSPENISPNDGKTAYTRMTLAETYAKLAREQNKAETKQGIHTFGAVNSRFQLAIKFCALCHHCGLNQLPNGRIDLQCFEGETPLQKVSDGAVTTNDVKCSSRLEV
jgi:hypothetical protein